MLDLHHGGSAVMMNYIQSLTKWFKSLKQNAFTEIMNLVTRYKQESIMPMFGEKIQDNRSLLAVASQVCLWWEIWSLLVNSGGCLRDDNEKLRNALYDTLDGREGKHHKCMVLLTLPFYPYMHIMWSLAYVYSSVTVRMCARMCICAHICVVYV